MDSGSKCLIIEDEKNGISDFSKVLCSVLPSFQADSEQREKEWLAIPLNMPKPESGRSASDKDKDEYYFNQFNAFWAGNAICPKSFEDAYRLVNAIGAGEEYELIFIDRNLENYHDIKNGNEIQIDEKKFTKTFFEGLNGFAGDFLFLMLVNAGVPIEKICFLTANNDASIEDMEKSLFLQKKLPPKIISKTDKGYKEVKEILNDCQKAKIRFGYKELFENKKVCDIFGENINKFIAILAKQSKHENSSKDDGNTLRKMLEDVVPYIAVKFFSCKWKPGSSVSVRNFLNSQSDYKAKLPNKEHWDMYQNWLKLSVELGRFPISTKDQKYIENTYFPNLEKATGIKKDKKDAEKIIKYSTAKVLHLLYDHFYRDNSSTNIPKYIFSYIDNIYTVTSEVSSHGPNDKTTDGLSPDGWSALLSGMLQIMQWVADTNPNPTSPQS